MKQYYKYVNEVLEGKIKVGQLIYLACKRFKSDLERSDLFFDEKTVDRAIDFIGILKHFKGKSSNQHFNLEPWQQFVIANIVGWYWEASKTRRYTSSYIEVSRKQGKTALAAALCLYYLIADGEDGAEVDLAANSKEQAKIAFEFCSQFAKQLDNKGKLLGIYRDSITLNTNASKLRVFAADDSKLDGFNASFGLIDEYHSAKNSKVRDVIKSSMGMRTNPHLCTITTAGFDKSLPCYQLRTTAVDILNEVKTDDSMFIAIYCLDDTDDWTNEENWIKCAPNLGITVTSKYLKEQVTSAQNNPSEEVGVKTKNLNIWCDSIDVWISDNYIYKASQRINLNNFTTEDICYIGIDLSATSDLTAVSYLIPKNDEYYYHTDYYLPQSCLTDSPNKEMYKLWHKQGMLTLTSGNVVDYDYILKDILKNNKKVTIYKVGYDKWNATQFAIAATEQGLPLEEYSQSIGNFNQPTKELERLILSGKVKIDSNDITRWCFRNIVLKEDWNNNCKPVKASKNNKIDGVIAMIQALGMFLEFPTASNDIFVM